jgi:hypothetical protein
MYIGYLSRLHCPDVVDAIGNTLTVSRINLPALVLTTLSTATVSGIVRTQCLRSDAHLWRNWLRCWFAGREWSWEGRGLKEERFR